MQIRNIILVTVTFLLSSCAKHEHFNGYSFDQKEIEAIEIGKTSEEDLRNLLGSPTTISNFGDKTYYYISMQQQSEAFLLPHTVAQDVLEITFNQDNRIKDVHSYSLNEARNVNYATGTTELKGNKMTPLEQIFNNIGKFNRPKQPKQF